jgi:hypothetical protein
MDIEGNCLLNSPIVLRVGDATVLRIVTSPTDRRNRVRHSLA